MKFLCILIMLFIATPAHAYTCRNSVVKRRFDTMSGYPHGRPSLPGEEKWIVDHICALGNGGRDSVKNMQYQSLSKSRKKDLIENTWQGKKLFCTPQNSTPTRQVFNCKR